MKNMHRAWILAAAIGGVLLCGRPAHAQSAGFGDGLSNAGGFLVPLSYDLLLGLPPLVANSVAIHRNERAVVWPIIGIVGGAAIAGLTMAWILPNASATDSQVPAYNWGMWVGSVAWGLTDIGLGIAVLAIPSHRPAAAGDGHASRSLRWSLTPLAARDAAGQSVPGASLSIVNF